MLQETESEQAEADHRRRNEDRLQMRQELRQSRKDFLVMMRWPNTILAAFLVTLAIFGLITGLVRRWSDLGILLAACWMTAMAWQGWYYHRRQNERQH